MPPIRIGRNWGVAVGRRERACASIPWLLPWYFAFRAFICRFALANRDFTQLRFTLFLTGKMIDIAITHAAAAKLVLTSGIHFAMARAAGNSFNCIFLLARGVIKRTKCYYRKIWGKYKKQLNWKWKGQEHCAELLLSCMKMCSENVFRKKNLASLSHNIYSSCLRRLLKSNVGNYVYQTSVSQDL